MRPRLTVLRRIRAHGLPDVDGASPTPELSAAAIEGPLDRSGGHAGFPYLGDRRQWGSRDLDGAVVIAIARSRPGNGVGCATTAREHAPRPAAGQARRDIDVGHLAAVHQHGDRGPP